MSWKCANMNWAKMLKRQTVYNALLRSKVGDRRLGQSKQTESALPPLAPLIFAKFFCWEPML